MPTRSLVCAALLAVLPAACAPRVTYPPTAGKPYSTPNVAPGPELMADSLREAWRVSGAQGEIAFNLPSGLAESTWRRVQELLGNGARPMGASDDRAYSVQQLRIDGGTAEVDVVYPDRGVYQLMTVRLRGGAFADWKVASAYRWVSPCAGPVPNAPVGVVVRAEPAIEPAAPEAAPSESSPSASTTATETATATEEPETSPQ